MRYRKSLFLFFMTVFVGLGQAATPVVTNGDTEVFPYKVAVTDLPDLETNKPIDRPVFNYPGLNRSSQVSKDREIAENFRRIEREMNERGIDTKSASNRQAPFRLDADIALIIIALLINGIIFGSFCSYLAGRKGKDSGSWAWLGFVFGIIALLVLIGTPKEDSQPENASATESTDNKESAPVKDGEYTKCPFCAEQIKLEAIKCRYCKSELIESQAY